MGEEDWRKNRFDEIFVDTRIADMRERGRPDREQMSVARAENKEKQHLSVTSGFSYLY